MNKFSKIYCLFVFIVAFSFCKVGAHNSLKGSNLLYLYQGLNEHPFSFYIEDAKSYNIDVESFVIQISFFDFDLDRDLDCFLFNHSVNPKSNYGNGNRRNEFNAMSGDKLLRNDDGKMDIKGKICCSKICELKKL